MNGTTSARFKALLALLAQLAPSELPAQLVHKAMLAQPVLLVLLVLSVQPVHREKLEQLEQQAHKESKESKESKATLELPAQLALRAMLEPQVQPAQ